MLEKNCSKCKFKIPFFSECLIEKSIPSWIIWLFSFKNINLLCKLNSFECINATQLLIHNILRETLTKKIGSIVLKCIFQFSLHFSIGLWIWIFKMYFIFLSYTKRSIVGDALKLYKFRLVHTDECEKVIFVSHNTAGLSNHFIISTQFVQEKKEHRVLFS